MNFEAFSDNVFFEDADTSAADGAEALEIKETDSKATLEELQSFFAEQEEIRSVAEGKEKTFKPPSEDTQSERSQELEPEKILDDLSSCGIYLDSPDD